MCEKSDFSFVLHTLLKVGDKNVRCISSLLICIVSVYNKKQANPDCISPAQIIPDTFRTFDGSFYDCDSHFIDVYIVQKRIRFTIIRQSLINNSPIQEQRYYQRYTCMGVSFNPVHHVLPGIEQIHRLNKYLIHPIVHQDSTF